jgi:hypothetical protein
MAIGIDFGQMNAGLNAIKGFSKGLTQKREIRETVTTMATMSYDEFGELADRRASGSLAHVYEYGRPHKGGRLWEIVPSQFGDEVNAKIIYHMAKVPSKPDPYIVAEAAAKGRSVASHRWVVNKAEHLEKTRVLVSRPGIQKFTQRIGGDRQPKKLVMMDSNGEIFFPKKWVRNNQYYNKFTEFFEEYWQKEIQVEGQRKVEAAFVSTVDYGADLVQTEIAKSPATPVIPPNQSGVFITDNGKRSRGVEVNERRSQKLVEPVAKRLSKELKRRWRRK